MSLSKYLFHKPEIMRLLMERQKALKAVRDVVSGKASAFGAGATAKAFEVGDKIVKVPTASSRIKVEPGDGVAEFFKEQARKSELNEFTRRAFLKNRASESGAAPETFLVGTNKNKYLVQDKLTPVNEAGRTWWWDFEKKGGQRDQVIDKLKEAGINPRDINENNVGISKDGLPMSFDLGMSTAKGAMPESERQRALMRFIQKNRKKDWLKD